MKIDKTVWKETAYVAAGTFGLGIVMLVVYSLIRPFEMKALYGAVYGSVAAILNFFFMAYTLQKAVEINADGGEDKDDKVKLKIKASYAVRSMVYLLSIAAAIVFGWCDVFMLVIPMLFPQIVARIRMIWLNGHGE